MTTFHIHHVLQGAIEKDNGNPLQYYCLENHRDGGAGWTAVYGVARSRTQLSNFTFTLEKDMDSRTLPKIINRIPSSSVNYQDLEN